MLKRQPLYDRYIGLVICENHVSIFDLWPANGNSYYKTTVNI